MSVYKYYFLPILGVFFVLWLCVYVCFISLIVVNKIQLYILSSLDGQLYCTNYFDSDCSTCTATRNIYLYSYSVSSLSNFSFHYFMCKIFPNTFGYMSLIHYNGSVFYIKNWRFFTLFCFLNTFCLIFYKFTLGGSGYKRFVCTVAAFVCHLFDTLVLFWYWDVLFEY